jgi:hypothetical protein
LFALGELVGGFECLFIWVILRIDEIAAILIKGIQDLEGGLFVAFSQSLLPRNDKISLNA